MKAAWLTAVEEALDEERRSAPWWSRLLRGVGAR